MAPAAAAAEVAAAAAATSLHRKASWVGWRTLIVLKPVLEAPMVSALERTVQVDSVKTRVESTYGLST